MRTIEPLSIRLKYLSSMIRWRVKDNTIGHIVRLFDKTDKYKEYPPIREFSFLVRQKEFSCLGIKFQWLYAFNPPKCKKYLQENIKRLGLWQKFQDVHSWGT